MSWWNEAYLFRRKLKISNTFEDAESGHMVLAPVSIEDLYNSGKTRSDYEDVEVVHQSDDATPVLTVLARDITEDGVVFFLEEDLDKDDVSEEEYYIYYGNFELIDAPDRPEYIEDLWPVDRGYDDPNFSYTRPGDWWDEGVSSEPNAVAIVRMSGSRFKLVSAADDDQGIIEISIDNGEWVDIDLFSITPGEEDVYEITDISPTKHRVQLRVTGRKNPSSLSTEVNIVRVEYQIPITVENVGEEIYNFDWSSLMSGV